MSLIKLDTSKPENKFLQPFIENSEKILKEYEDNKSNLTIYESGYCIGWWLVLPYRQGEVEESKYFPTLKSIIDDLPEDITPVNFYISDVIPNLPQAPHNEDLPKGIQRYHIPLKHNPNARLNVLKDDCWFQYQWEEKSVFQFLDFENIHYISSDGGGENRIVIMLDVFKGDVTEQQLADAKQWYDNWESVGNFHTVDVK